MAETHVYGNCCIAPVTLSSSDRDGNDGITKRTATALAASLAALYPSLSPAVSVCVSSYLLLYTTQPVCTIPLLSFSPSAMRPPTV